MSTRECLESDIIHRIKAVMAARRITLRALSDTADVPYSSLQSYMMGKHSIPAAVLKKIVEYLDVSADYILFGRAARLDLHLLQEVFAELERRRLLPKNQVWSVSSFEELAKMFDVIYDKDYIGEFRPASKLLRQKQAGSKG